MINRRDFLKLGIGSAALIGLPGWEALADSVSGKRNWIVFGCGHDIARVDIASGECRSITTPTKSHSVTAFPGEPDKVVGVEKWDMNLSVVDFKTSTLVKTIQPPTDRRFYGHVCWSRDGKQLISPQMDLKTDKGYLVWYDRETMKVESEMEVDHGGSHDLAFLPGTDILVVTASGLIPDYNHPEQGPRTRVATSAVSFYDAKERKLVKRWNYDDPSTFPGHLKVDHNGNVYLLSSVFGVYKGPNANKAGSVFDLSLDKPLTEWTMPREIRERLDGELLSIAINEKLNRLVATNPTTRQIVTFDLATKRFLSISEAGTTGIVWDLQEPLLYGMQSRHPRPVMNTTLPGFSYKALPTEKMSAHIVLVQA